MSTARAYLMSDAVTGKSGVRSAPRGDVQQTQVTSFVDLSPKLWEALETIRRLASLHPDWDSYGSSRLHGSAIAGVLHVLKVSDAESLPAPGIVPVSGGGVQIEWRTPTRELELEILPDGSIEFLREGETGTPDEGSLPSYRDTHVRQYMRWLMHGDSQRR